MTAADCFGLTSGGLALLGAYRYDSPAALFLACADEAARCTPAGRSRHVTLWRVKAGHRRAVREVLFDMRDAASAQASLDALEQACQAAWEQPPLNHFDREATPRAI